MNERNGLLQLPGRDRSPSRHQCPERHDQDRGVRRWAWMRRGTVPAGSGQDLVRPLAVSPRPKHIPGRTAIQDDQDIAVRDLAKRPLRKRPVGVWFVKTLPGIDVSAGCTVHHTQRSVAWYYCTCMAYFLPRQQKLIRLRSLEKSMSGVVDDK